VQVRVKGVGLNCLDRWGYRGMAFARRKLPPGGVEAAGAAAAVGNGMTPVLPGDPVVMYGALACGMCRACRDGRDNLCENIGGIMGYHADGFARNLITGPGRLVIKAPAGIAMRNLTCAPIAFGTVDPGEGTLVHAGGSGIGTVTIRMAKAIGCAVITTVGDDAKADKARALGADTFAGSLLSPKRGDRLASHLMQLLEQQYRIFGSFGASIANIRTALKKMAGGLMPVIDTEVALADFEQGLARVETRQVFGKVIVNF
jgi:alcohol dehydrogenase